MNEIVTLRTGSFPASAFRVRSLRGTEALSAPFELELVVEASGAAAADLRVPGTHCQVRLFEGATVARELNAVVRSVRTEGRAGEARILRVELVPQLWIGGLRRTRRIFQDATVPAIVRMVLEEHGVDSDWRLFRDTATYPQREYCVQYDETDVGFVERLLAEEQIFYFFETKGDKTVLVLADEPDAYQALTPSVLTHTDSAAELALDKVRTFGVTAAIAPRAATLRDYEPSHPGLDQHVHVKVPESPAAPPRYEVFDYPGGYSRPAHGKHRVGLNLRALRRDAVRGRGASYCRRLAPAHKFTLEEHPFDDHNRSWVVVAVKHTHLAWDGVSKPTYECEFECVASDVAYLPQRIARPTVSGIESAVITGAPGEEITVDDAGRVHVEFHWDRDDFGDARSSCWIRVAQTWSGTGFGFVFIPRVGMEVIVSFLGGDPDRPIITGCAYNADHPHPYKLPEHKTRSTIRTRSTPGGEGFNELRFEDRAKQEQVYLHAQRNLDEHVGANHGVAIGGSRHETVGLDLTQSIGGDLSETVAGSRFTTVTRRWLIGVGKPAGKANGVSDSALKMTPDFTELLAQHIRINAKMGPLDARGQVVNIGAATRVTVSGSSIHLGTGIFRSPEGQLTMLDFIELDGGLEGYHLGAAPFRRKRIATRSIT